MTQQIKHPLRSNRGFNMIEIMVAVVVGMISILVVLQVFSASEANKRTTTGGDDAQISGAIGLYEMEHDIRQAGFGISSMGLFDCSLKLAPNASAAVVTVPLLPVTINPSIIPAADANTDRLLVIYASPIGSTDGDSIAAVSTAHPPTYTMNSGEGYNVGDIVVVAPQPPVTAANPQTCTAPLTLDKVTAVTAPNVTVTTGGGTAGTLLYDLGQTFTVIGYAVRNGSLTSCNYTDVTKDCTSTTTTGNWIEIAGNVPMLRALYGRDTNGGNMSGIVDTWDQTQPTSTCTWIRMSAISVAIVSRNNQLSTTPVTTAAPVWSEPAWTGATMGSAIIDLSGTNSTLPSGATWQNYRYKLYSTLVPMQNVTWMGKVSGC